MGTAQVITRVFLLSATHATFLVFGAVRGHSMHGIAVLT